MVKAKGMGKELFIINSLHNSTKRKYLPRMINEKVKCMIEAKKFGKNYWDGPRKFGYGGYKYIPDRWKNVAKKLIKKYKLSNKSKILDVGCGKGYLLYEIKKILPNIQINGIDISKYAVQNSHDQIKKYIKIHKAENKYKFKKKYFDLVISIGCLHNLKINDLEKSIKEINRVGKCKYILVESYKNEIELFNLQCWALTCQSFFSKKEWKWIFNLFGYTGDYEFIYFK